MRHPDYNNEHIAFVSGCVGEGGDHVNITLKNNGEEAITIKGEEVVCVIQLKRGEEVETGTDNSEEKSEICESLKDNVVEEESSGGEKVQESSRLEAEEVSNKSSGSVDGSGDNKVDKEDENNIGDQREEPMETEDTQEDEE